MPPPAAACSLAAAASIAAITLARDSPRLKTHHPANEPSMSRLLSRVFILSLSFLAGSYLVASGTAGVSSSGSASGADAPIKSGKSSVAEWPQWRGPGRDGISPDTGLLQDWNT